VRKREKEEREGSLEELINISPSCTGCSREGSRAIQKTEIEREREIERKRSNE